VRMGEDSATSRYNWAFVPFCTKKTEIDCY
jgi:hypothetical protein